MLTNHVRKWLLNVFRVWLLGVSAILIACLPIAIAHATDTSFNIQVSPSPVVLTLTPGQTQTATVTVRNFSNHNETLIPGLTGLQIGASSEDVSLQHTAPADMENWVHFSVSPVAIGPGQSIPLTVTFDTPQDVGFSYAVGITLTSTTATVKPATGTAIKPEVVVFCLINVNRPDAKSSLSITKFSGDKSSYAFLPATFSLQLANNGNVIEQPSGTLFIQRSYDDSTPIAAIPINDGGGYILPSTTRTFSSSWTSGFPAYVSSANGKKHLVWDWKHLNEFRFGKYVARAVVVYNSGQTEIPITDSFTFWVIPWWLLSIVLLTLIVVVTGLVGWGWLLFKGTKKVKGLAGHAHAKKK